MCDETMHVVIGTADFQQIKSLFSNGVDDVTYPMRKDQCCLRLQTVCQEDRTEIKSGRDYLGDGEMRQ